MGKAAGHHHRGYTLRARAGRDRVAAPSRLALLHEAGGRIGSTLDLERTAQELTDFTVPRLADAAAVDLLESLLRGEEVDRWRGPGLPATRAMALTWIPSLSRLEPDPLGSETIKNEPTYASEAMATGRPILVSRIAPDQYDRIVSRPSAARQMRMAGVHSYLAVPMLARGVLLGMADFVRAGRRPGFTPTDLALITELISKAAVALDNARLYRRERQTVVTLQRSLLPKDPESVPGLDVTCTYAPAAESSAAGGDWYDVMALPGGRSALVVGDVMGRGLNAAATMGRLRSIARVLLNLDISPERVLARLDLAARDLEEDQVATCLCAVYDPAEGVCTMASAGQVPPILLGADGKAEFVDLPVGAPVGTGAIPYDSARIPLPDGSRLLLYTDGLARTGHGDLAEDLERLRQNVAAAGPEQLEAGGFVVPPAGTSDDSVLLLARPTAALLEPDLRVWDLPGDGSAAGQARRLVRRQLAQWHMSALDDAAELVVSELVANALRYGRGAGPMRMIRGDRLVIELSDQGPDLPQIQHASLSDEGGRGLQLVNALCRRWGSCRTPYGKVVWAEFDRPAH